MGKKRVNSMTSFASKPKWVDYCMSLNHCQKWSTKVRFSQIMEVVAMVAWVTQEMVVPINHNSVAGILA